MPITKIRFGTFDVDESTGGADVLSDISDAVHPTCDCSLRETKSAESDATCEVRKTRQVSE
jgi:hypothetical protein